MCAFWKYMLGLAASWMCRHGAMWSCGIQASMELKDLATFDKEKWNFIEKLCFLIKKRLQLKHIR